MACKTKTSSTATIYVTYKVSTGMRTEFICGCRGSNSYVETEMLLYSMLSYNLVDYSIYDYYQYILLIRIYDKYY